MEFGLYLKTLREKAGLTMRELDKRTGVSHSYISKMESGSKGIPSPETLKKLSKALKVPYLEMMKVAGYINETQSLTNSEIVAQEIATKYFIAYKRRITDWIENDLADNDNTSTEFERFAKQYKFDEDVSDMTLEEFINLQMGFLDSKRLWNNMNDLYDRLVEEITSEEVNTNDERTDYYASVL